MNTLIADNIARVRAQMAAACQAADRAPDSVKLLAVSKTWSADAVRTAYGLAPINHLRLRPSSS